METPKQDPRTLLILHLTQIAQLSMLRPDTLAISGVLFALVGAAVVNKDTEFALAIEPEVVKMQKELKAKLAEAEEEARLAEVEGEKAIGEEGLEDEINDFFDKNEIIH